MSAVTSSLKYQIKTNRLGLWVFMFSESAIFLALLGTRFYMQGMARPAEMNQVLGLILTSVLLISSFFANRAEVYIARGEPWRFLGSLVVTMVMGLVFLLGVVGVEWPEAMHFAPPSKSFGSMFFAITGLHAFHVLTGILILLFVFLNGLRRDRYSAQNHWGAEAGIVYWHFVDVVWVFVYAILYLVGP